MSKEKFNASSFRSANNSSVGVFMRQWERGNYMHGDLVFVNSTLYACAQDRLSSISFESELAQDKWFMIGGTTSSAKQDIGNAFLGSLDRKMPSLDGNSMPVYVSGTAVPLVTLTKNCTYFTDTIDPLKAKETFTGEVRDTGTNPGLAQIYQKFCVMAQADQPGTFIVEASPDNEIFRQVSPVVNVAPFSDSGGSSIEIPITMRFYRVAYLNGTKNQESFALTSSFC